MRVEGPRKGTRIPGGPEAYRRLDSAQTVAGREEIVKSRLSSLFAALGVPPPDRPSGLADWRPALRRFLDGSCPPGTVVMHGRRLPDRPLALEHLVIAPRGLVVVGPSFGHVLRDGHTNRGAGGKARPVASRLGPPLAGATAAAPATAGAGDRRPALVRETLRRCYALRTWLGGSRWDAVPVLAAVCSCPVVRAPAPPWMMLDGLWLGTADQLPAWLVSEDILGPGARTELGRFLAEALPIG